MLDRNDHDLLVSRLYASAMGDAPWSQTLAEVAAMFRSDAAVLRVADSSGQAVAAASSRHDSGFAIQYYHSEVYANDPRRPYLEGTPAGSIYYDHMLYDVEAMSRDRWCKEAIDILKVKYQLGAAMSLPHDGMAWLAILSTEAEGHAGDAAIESFRRLTPYLEQACALGQLLETQAATRSALIEALACKADGLVLLDRAGTPTFMNDAAQAMLAASDGLAFERGAFHTRRGPETRRLQQMIGEALIALPRLEAAPGGQMLVTRPSGARPYVLRVMAAPPTERFLAGRAIAAVIHIHDLSAARLPSRATLSEVFGLTEREADLAVALVRCAGLAEAASDAGMATNTARNHLQGVFRKTGARTQAEAVQLLGRVL